MTEADNILRRIERRENVPAQQRAAGLMMPPPYGVVAGPDNSPFLAAANRLVEAAWRRFFRQEKAETS